MMSMQPRSQGEVTKGTPQQNTTTGSGTNTTSTMPSSRSGLSPSPMASCQRDFQEAVRNGDKHELLRILEERQGKVNVNSFDTEGMTALHQSVIDGNFELVKVLVKFGADVRLANRDGWNALHIACYGGRQDIALYLVNAHKR